MWTRIPISDAATLRGVAWLRGRGRDRRLEARDPAEEDAFVAAMSGYPIAIATEFANSQHYELPPALFARMLGPRLKYSCCLFERPEAPLAEAERAALDVTIARAELADGQNILEWGCGWGSLTLRMAERFPAARVLAITNSGRSANSCSLAPPSAA